MQREVIKPQVDVPVIVKLDKGPEGQEREGKYGIDYQYTCNDDQAVMWLPKDARDMIVRSGAQAGDLLQIVKTLHGRQSVYSIQVLPPPTTRDYRIDPSMTPPRTNGYTNGHASASRTTTVEMPRELPAPAAVPATAAPAPPPQHRPGAQQLQGAICAAIDAAMGSEDYARNKGRALTFSEESIRAFALTLLIGEQKAGRS